MLVALIGPDRFLVGQSLAKYIAKYAPADSGLGDLNLSRLDGDPPDLFVESLQRHGAFRRAALRANQVADPRSLLALFVNGEDLTPDHGHPARVIVPAAPGVLNTKWVARLTFGDL